MADDSQVQNATNPSAQPEPMALPPLLLGTYTPKIDAKGRMALPAKLRSQLGAGLVMARGQERCVYLLPQSEFRRIAIQIQHTSMGDKAARDYLRVFLSTKTRTSRDECWYRRCCATTRTSATTSW